MKTLQDFLHIMNFNGVQMVQGPKDSFSAALNDSRRWIRVLSRTLEKRFVHFDGLTYKKYPENSFYIHRCFPFGFSITFNPIIHNNCRGFLTFVILWGWNSSRVHYFLPTFSMAFVPKVFFFYFFKKALL